MQELLQLQNVTNLKITSNGEKLCLMNSKACMGVSQPKSCLRKTAGEIFKNPFGSFLPDMLFWVKSLFEFQKFIWGAPNTHSIQTEWDDNIKCQLFSNESPQQFGSISSRGYFLFYKSHHCCNKTLSCSLIRKLPPLSVPIFSQLRRVETINLLHSSILQ